MQVVLHGKLCGAVWALRPRGMVLRGRELLLLSVNRSAGGSENDFFDAELLAVVYDVYGADHVYLGVRAGVVNGIADADLRRMVADDVGFFVGENIGDVLMPDVGKIELRAGVKVLSFAGEEVINDDNLHPRVDSRIGYMGAYETRSAGYKYFHKKRILRQGRGICKH